MSQHHLPTPWAAAKKFALALPLLALSALAVPHAHADDHYGRLHHEIRRDERHGNYGAARADRRELHYREGHRYGPGYYHNGAYYSHRRYYYRDGVRQYGYYGLVPGGVSVNIGM